MWIRGESNHQQVRNRTAKHAASEDVTKHGACVSAQVAWVFVST